MRHRLINFVPLCVTQAFTRNAFDHFPNAETVSVAQRKQGIARVRASLSVLTPVSILESV